MADSLRKTQKTEPSESIKIFLSDREILWELHKKTGKSLKQLMREAIALLKEEQIDFSKPAEPIIQFVNPPQNFSATIEIKFTNPQI